MTSVIPAFLTMHVTRNPGTAKLDHAYCLQT